MKLIALSGNGAGLLSMEPAKNYEVLTPGPMIKFMLLHAREWLENTKMKTLGIALTDIVLVTGCTTATTWATTVLFDKKATASFRVIPNMDPNVWGEWKVHSGYVRHQMGGGNGQETCVTFRGVRIVKRFYGLGVTPA